MPAPSLHIPVLLNEVLHYLNPQPGQVMVDGTLGGGGHTRALAQRVAPGGFVLALDADPLPIARAEVELKGQCVQLAHARYCDLPDLLKQLELPAVEGVLLDLGLSSDQLADGSRGFSFDAPGELDLRFDPTEGEPAFVLLERWSEKALADVIFRYGEERFSRRIAREIVRRRQEHPLRGAQELAELVRRVVPHSRDTQRIDPATRTFQALRIAVNDELGGLERTLRKLPELLKPGGTAAIISFHSLEDRLVKDAFRGDARWEVVTSKPVVAGTEELQANPRARSAKLRVARRR